jgi:hypothetical protein
VKACGGNGDGHYCGFAVVWGVVSLARLREPGPYRSGLGGRYAKY